MIHELSKTDFSRIIKLLNPSIDNIEVNCVISGMNPGRIFADSQTMPTSALVFSQGVGGFYFVGNSNNISFVREVNDYIDSTLAPQLLSKGIRRFEFSGETDDWPPVFDAMFQDRPVEKTHQLIYRLNGHAWDKHTHRTLKDGYDLRNIDMNLYNDRNKIDISLLSNEMPLWWDSWDDYDKHAFGYCIVHDHTLVNFCMCDYVYQDIRPMGIETLADHRRNGLSQVTTEAYVSHCLRNGLQPHWECMESNTASRTLAEKLGFRQKSMYTLYAFSFKR